jgi:hypothetical protein
VAKIYSYAIFNLPWVETIYHTSGGDAQGNGNFYFSYRAMAFRPVFAEDQSKKNITLQIHDTGIGTLHTPQKYWTLTVLRCIIKLRNMV